MVLVFERKAYIMENFMVKPVRRLNYKIFQKRQRMFLYMVREYGIRGPTLRRFDSLIDKSLACKMRDIND